MNPGAGAFKAFKNAQALGRLQEQTQCKATGHDHGHDQGNALGFQVEAVAIEYDADNRPENDQGNQAGKDGFDQALFDIDRFIMG
ncbi:hypothetical protein D3C71_2041220 [compost metagenome]